MFVGGAVRGGAGGLRILGYAPAPRVYRRARGAAKRRACLVLLRPRRPSARGAPRARLEPPPRALWPRRRCRPPNRLARSLDCRRPDSRERRSSPSPRGRSRSGAHLCIRGGPGGVNCGSRGGGGGRRASGYSTAGAAQRLSVVGAGRAPRSFRRRVRGMLGGPGRCGRRCGLCGLARALTRRGTRRGALGGGGHRGGAAC